MKPSPKRAKADAILDRERMWARFFQELVVKRHMTPEGAAATAEEMCRLAQPRWEAACVEADRLLEEAHQEESEEYKRAVAQR